MVAVGVGGADADVMAGMPWELKFLSLSVLNCPGRLRLVKR